MGTIEERVTPQITQNSGGASLDVTKPTLFKVGLLGEQYDSWVHRPQPTRVRLFESDVLESLSSFPWYIVPFWLLLALYSLRRGVITGCLTWGHGFLCLFCGFMLWQPLEYGFHRFLFHTKPTGYWAITFHFLFHGVHHKCPTDAGRLVFPPHMIGLMMWAVLKTFGLVLSPGVNLCVGSGLIVAYVLYDCVHYMFHHAGMPFGILGALKTKHLSHHYKNHKKGYGVTGNFMDIVFETM